MERETHVGDDVVNSSCVGEGSRADVVEFASGSDVNHGMTLQEILALPVAVDLTTAGRAWHLGRTKSHELARAGEFPCRVLRLGSQYRVTRSDLLDSLGIDPGAPAVEVVSHLHVPDDNEESEEVDR